MREKPPAHVLLLYVCCLSVTFALSGAEPCDAEGVEARVCLPHPVPVSSVELGKAGVFHWNCSGGTNNSRRYYVVFVRPSGTYVLLKVPDGRTSFEFTPDTTGRWRWIVINTDPDRTKPDRESEPGYFDVVEKEGT